MTRMPVSCSRVIWLTRSILFCICVKAGTMRTTMRPTMTRRIGIDTAMSHESPAS